jgi:hypothetical protein
VAPSTMRRLARISTGKWGGTCIVQVFAMEVEEEVADWAEAGTRRRAWLTVGEATQRVDEEALRQIFYRFIEGR